jgi:hypothetical protein
LKESLYKLFNYRVILFLSVLLSLFGLFQFLSIFLLLRGFPLEFLEIDIPEQISFTFMALPLLFWNIPLLGALIWKFFFKA